jgi:iron complex outermembrane receptor protein
MPFTPTIFFKSKYIFYSSLFWICFYGLYGQQPSATNTITLDAIELQSTKLNSARETQSQALSVYDFSQRQLHHQQLSLQEYLRQVPGLFTLNANNYAQDLRLAIRGFGARAAFGIRGVKLVVDGIPETTPDGQGQVDNIPLPLIERIEILRGPASSLYGNAAGGVLYLSTMDSLPDDAVRFSTLLGSYGLQSFQAQQYVSTEKTKLLLFETILNTQGFREQSQLKQRQFNAKLTHQFSNQSKLLWQLNYTNSPEAGDPGGLTLEEAQANRSQARKRNVDYNTYEKINHFKTGVQWKKEFQPGLDWTSYAFYSFRDFYGKLPFENGGIVDLKRNYYGFGTAFKKVKPKHRWQMGIEWAAQADQRDRYANVKGIQADKTLSQLEQFAAGAIFRMDEIALGKGWFRTSFRLDQQRIGLNKTSTPQNYLAFNPGIGFYQPLGSSMGWFANFSTSFETPTLSELSANPTGQEGFNETLDPSRAQNFEVGWRLSNSTNRLEAVLFQIQSTNEILPYELEAFPGRSFYKNAGATRRYGLELQWEFELQQWEGEVAFTQAQFQIHSGNLKGKALPGLPQQQAQFRIRYHSNTQWVLQLEGQHTGRFYADNANAVAIENYQLLHLQAAKSIPFLGGAFSLLGGINNLLNTSYFDNIRLNAFGKRYYEPAPLRNFYIGLRIGL